MAHHPEFHARTKHIDISCHFVRDHVQKGTLDVIYVNTDENTADILTKGLPRDKHDKHTISLGVLSSRGGVLSSG